MWSIRSTFIVALMSVRPDRPLSDLALAWVGIVLGPAVAAVLMSASTVIVAINAQLLRRVDLKPGPVL